MRYGEGWDFMYGMHGFGWLFFLLFLVIAVWAVIMLVRTFGTGPTQPPRVDHALEILRERYARGELSDEEYEQKRQRLERTD